MIGIIPIGGGAKRMNGIPKFLLPIGDTFLLTNLYDNMMAAGAESIVVGVKSSNRHWLHDNEPEVGTVFSVDTETMSETVVLMQKYANAAQTVLFGMPDTYWTDEHVYQRLLGNLDYAIASVAVWDTLPSRRHKRGMCAIKDNRIVEVIDKPSSTPLAWGWGALVWRPAFWRYIKASDAHVGFAIQRAIEADEPISASKFPGQYFDCGTPDEYYECVMSVGKVLENA